jgi:hypothetical protein
MQMAGFRLTAVDSPFSLSGMIFRSGFVSLCLVSAAALSLGACESFPPKKDQAPKAEVVPAVTPPATEPVSVLPADVVGDRIAVLEQKVSGLQTEMATARPTLQKVDMMERHFRSLSLELDRIDRQYDLAKTVPVTPVEPQATEHPVAIAPTPLQKADTPPAPVKKPAESVPVPAKKAEKKIEKKAETPKVTSGAAEVRSVRIGKQPDGVTRIVLDTTSPARINYDLDNGERILVIEIPDTVWKAENSGDVSKSDVVSSFAADGDSASSRLVVQLKTKAKIVTTARLNPSGGSGYRVYLDLKADP